MVGVRSASWPVVPALWSKPGSQSFRAGESKTSERLLCQSRVAQQARDPPALSLSSPAKNARC
jgi:hypothetical protein